METHKYLGLIMIPVLAVGLVSALNYANAQGTNMSGTVKDKLMSIIKEKAGAAFAEAGKTLNVVSFICPQGAQNPNDCLGPAIAPLEIPAK